MPSPPELLILQSVRTIDRIINIDYITSSPEPESYALFMAGLEMMGFIARRRKSVPS